MKHATNTAIQREESLTAHPPKIVEIENPAHHTTPAGRLLLRTAPERGTMATISRKQVPMHANRPAHLAGALALALFVSACGVLAAQVVPASPGGDLHHDDDNATMARAAALYYSSSKAGLKGFDCIVHPDWQSLFLSANHTSSLTADQQNRVALLNSAHIVLHARMDDTSTYDWSDPPTQNSPVSDAASLLQSMHASSWQTLHGFLQFWSPFFDGSAVPSNATGSEVTHSADGFTMHAKTSDSEVTEIFGSDLILQHFNVISGGNNVRFDPYYSPTPQGLLVNRFHALIRPVNAPASADQEMRVGVQYQTVDGIPVPSHLDMEIVGTATFNMDFSDCTVVR